MAGIVLILGSAPGALVARDWPRAPFEAVVAINNAWRIRDDWDVSIHPDDFPAARHPVPGPRQRRVTAAAYVPVQNRFGGFVYAGGTMALTAGYWALGALRPRVLAWFGCDMVYPAEGKTHFYGTGTADPLRADVTLRSLEAKSARLALLAAREGTHCVNLSDAPSRLVFARARRDALPSLARAPLPPEPPGVAEALAAEAALGYRVPSGRYWEEAARFDPTEIDRVDALWRGAMDQGFSRYPVRNQCQQSPSTATAAALQTARPSQGELSDTPMKP